MNTLFPFVIEVTVTLVVAALLTGYLRPFLRKILIDLCGTEDRAQFWTAFSNILLIVVPVIFALNYRPEAESVQALFFEVAGKVSENLGGLLASLIGIGIVVSFFALIAPRPGKVQTK